MTLKMLALTYDIIRALQERGGSVATIADIAKRTGFSTMTVSRAFSAPEKLKPQTLDEIMTVAQELDFHPNNVASSLARKCTNIIFVYIPRELSATEQFVSQTVTAIGERLGEHGYSFLLSRSLPKGEGYDGMIMMGLSDDERQEVAKAKGSAKPVVLYGNSEEFSTWVDVDNYAGEKLAVDYLLEKGRKNIAAVAAPQNMHYAQERLQAYRDSLAEHGVPIEEEKIVTGDASEQGGFWCTKMLLDRGVQMDAIACATDTMAIGCIHALKEHGICVPEEVSVVGFDGFGHENIISPKLTTVRQPLFEVGVRLADTLIALLEGGKPQRVKISPKLQINESA